MARKLASIVEISKVSPIENADRLEVAEMKGKGWRVVIQKGEFCPGDLAVYFEIDSFLPADDERYAFLRDRCLRKFVSKGGNVLKEGIRIKTIKLRGIVSQGLVMPLSAFHEINERIQNGKYLRCTKDEWQKELDEICSKSSAPLDVIPYSESDYLEDVVGSDVTKLLKVEHYDEVKEQLQPQTGNALSGDAMGTFPSAYIPKTDEERIQNLGDWFDTMKGRKWQVSIKADGTSCTIAFSPKIDFDNPQIVCSRNLRLKRETASGTMPIYWQVAEKYNILNKLSEALLGGKEYALQGEVVGPGIQKDRNKESEYMFKCFRIYDIANQKFLNPNETVAFCKEFDIPHVEVLETDFPFFDEITTMEEALKFAEGKTKEGNEREGIVCKTCDDGEYASFKIVSNRYLLKQDD